MVGVLELVDALFEALEVTSLPNKVVDPLRVLRMNLHVDVRWFVKEWSLDALLVSEWPSVPFEDAPSKV